MTATQSLEELARDEILYLPIGAIDPDPEQPRLEVDDALADSIKQHGVLQAIQVRPHPVDADRFQIVDGERRWRGATRAKLATIPATLTLEVEDVADRLVRQIVRNEGKPLTPWEEAQAYRRIVDERRAAGDKKYGVVQLAQELGIAKSTVSDRLAIAEVPEPFVPLFKKGELSAAAAPIIRKFADVPKEKLIAAIREARDHWDWEEAVRERGPVPLDVVRNALVDELLRELQYLSPEAAKRYQGATVKLERGLFAVDVEQASRITAEINAEEEKKRTASRSAITGSSNDWQARERERRAKEAKALKKKRDEREAIFRGIAAKLPSAITGEWTMFVIRWLLQEMQQDSCRLACKALGLEAVKKKGHYMPDFWGAIVEFAQSLSPERRAPLLLQLILLRDTSVSPYDMRGPERLKAAAELLGETLDALKKDAPATNPLMGTPATIGETFSRIVTGVLKKRALAKTLPQMSNDWVTGQIGYIRGQLAKFDDPEHWPTDTPGLNTIGGRAGVYLSGVERDRVVADLALLEGAAKRRGLLGEGASPDPDGDDDDQLWDDSGLEGDLASEDTTNIEEAAVL